MDKKGFKPPELKTMAIDLADITSGGELEVTKDGYIAIELHRQGLECIYGVSWFQVDGVDGVAQLLADSTLGQRVDEYAARGVPVYLGPSAVLSELSDTLTVFSSDAQSVGLGIWVPRAGVEIDPSTISYPRLN